jgi:hypothetical protein
MDEIVEKHPWLLVVLFPLFWSGVLLLIGHIGGWGRIASKYRARDAFEGRRWSFQSGQFGRSNYGGCLTVGANQRGLRFSVFFPFRPGHPPIFVPWEDVSVTEGRWLFSSYADLSFRLAPGHKVRVSKRLGDRLQAERGSRWPGEGKEARPIEPT